MNHTDILNLIEEHTSAQAERVNGNELAEDISGVLSRFLPQHRQAIVDAMRYYITLRPAQADSIACRAKIVAKIWMAMDIASRMHLQELAPHVEHLIDDVQSGRILRIANIGSLRVFLTKIRS